jgi:acetyl-CoA acetyltransferase
MSGTLLLGGARTPFSRFGGALREVPSVELAAFGMRAIGSGAADVIVAGGADNMGRPPS